MSRLKSEMKNWDGAARFPERRLEALEVHAALLAGDDFRSARLVVILTWDEGSDSSNHIPTVVITRTTLGITSSLAYDHCSTLRTIEDVLHLPYLGCASTARSFRPAFLF